MPGTACLLNRSPAAAVLLGLLFAAARVAATEPPAFTADQMGGTLRHNFNAEPQTLNPLTSKDVYATIVHDHVFETLIERDPDTLEWRGLLADRWDISPDGLAITFHLDPRAAFADGHALTAKDVLFTFETVRNPGIDCRAAASYLEDCESCEIVDERTVRFLWKKPYFQSLEVSGTFAPILPQHIYRFKNPREFNDLNNRLVGSGPYRFVEWKTGQHILLVRNEVYWRRPPAFDRILFRFILEEQAAVQAFLSGDLDDLAVSPEWWVKLQSRPLVRSTFQFWRYMSPGNGYRYIAWNNARPLFADARVRRAMTHLIWREQILKTMAHGIGVVTTGPFWPRSPQVDAAIPPWPFDRREAARLLAEAGWIDRNGDGWLENPKGERFAFEFTAVSGDQMTRDLVRVLREEFRRMGIDMSIRMVEWSVFVTRLDNRDYDAIMLGWTGSVESDPYQIWHSSQIADRGSNHVGFRSAEADRLIEEARITLDPVRRNDLYHRFQRILHEEQPYTFLWAGESLRLVSPRIQGVRLHTLGLDWREWWAGPDQPARPAPPGRSPAPPWRSPEAAP